MEERIIKDEYGRGIRLKKTKDGYVDATDELAEKDELQENGQEVEETEEGYEEVAFEFPDLEEDDEDLVGLSPTEALALRKKKEEEEKARIAEYERYLQEGELLLDSKSFHAAELKFEKALKLDEEATEATVGYWRAKTADFTNPDELANEYVDSGFENLEGDLGYKAVDKIKSIYHEVFKAREEELKVELAPLEKTIKEKRESRRTVIKTRMKKSLTNFLIALLPTLVAFVLTCSFGSRIFSTREGEFITYTIIAGGVFLVGFIVTLVFTNKLLNVLRIHRANERDESTEEGRKALRLRDYIELYTRLTEGKLIEYSSETSRISAETDEKEEETTEE